MNFEVGAMMVAGVTALAAGSGLARPRLRSVSGAEKILVLAPVFEASALAVFAAEHFTAAHDLLPIVPHWLPVPMFWVYFVGSALLAATISFIAWRHVRWSAGLLAVLFLIIVATIGVPGLPRGLHNRIFWILFVREISFAGGAMVLAAAVWPGGPAMREVLVRAGRSIVAAVMIFYAIEHFLFPHNVPGVPLEKMTPAWMPAPVVISYIVGASLLIGGVALFIPRAVRLASAGTGTVLLLVTIFFYGAIFSSEMHTRLAVEGLNYIFDTMLFAATVMLAGFGASQPTSREIR